MTPFGLRQETTRTGLRKVCRGVWSAGGLLNVETQLAVRGCIIPRYHLVTTERLAAVLWYGAQQFTGPALGSQLDFRLLAHS